MLSTYRSLIEIPGAWRFLAAGALARIGVAMFGVAIIVMIATRRDSYGLAGAISAGGIVVLALSGPVIGRLADKYGQGRASRPFVVTSVAAGLLTVTLSAIAAPAWTLFIGYAVSTFLPQIGPMSRARWAHLLRDKPEALHSAMSLEQVLEESSFVIGPVLAVFAATTFFPEAGLLLGYLLVATGSLLFLAQRSSEPPVIPHDERPRGVAIMRPGVFIVTIAMFMVGAVFGGNDVVAVAIADEAERSRMGAVILGAFALGSALAAIAFGARTFTGPIGVRFVYCAAAMCVLQAPVLLTQNLWVLTVIMFIAGSATAPTLITGITLMQQLVPRALVTEGLALAITGLLVGLASGTALGGILIDRFGAHPTFALPVLAALIAALLAAVNYRRLSHALANATVAVASRH